MAALGALLCAASAQAHLLPKQTVTINLLDKAAFCVVSVPVSALQGVDDDGDGRLSLAEWQAHREDIQTQYRTGFRVTEEGNPGASALDWVVPPEADENAQFSDYAIVLSRIDFANVPRTLTAATTLFGTRAGESKVTVKVTRAGQADVAILEPDAASYTFFRGGLATFAAFLHNGVEHIIDGADHLLFLLTVVVAAVGWRYWLAVVTTFTVAHSLTLSLAALDVLRVSPTIVEPGIALSIVGVALLNLLRPVTDVSHQFRSRLGVVFACGLLHGFGFASAIGAMSIDGSTRIAALAGFNIGIEIGQCLAVGAALLVAAIVGRFVAPAVRAAAPKAASLVALVCAVVMFLQRI